MKAKQEHTNTKDNKTTKQKSDVITNTKIFKKGKNNRVRKTVEAKQKHTNTKRQQKTKQKTNVTTINAKTMSSLTYPILQSPEAPIPSGGLATDAQRSLS